MRRSQSPFALRAGAAALLGAIAAPAQNAAGGDWLPAFTAATRQSLAAHPFFGSITLIEWTASAPFVFFLQAPPKDDPIYARKVVNAYAPFVAELRRVFEQDYTGPLGLERSAGTPGIAIAVLNSRGSYANYAQKMQADELHYARAHYDPALRLAVTYVDAYAPEDTGPQTRRAVLHETVHALQHAYSATGAMPRALWLNEGLADFRSTGTNVASSLRTPELDAEQLRTLAATLGHPQIRPLFAPFSDLLDAETLGDVLQRAQQRLGAMPEPAFALQVFYAQSAALVGFLHGGEDGRHRRALLDATAAVLRGESGSGALAAALQQSGGPTLAQLEATFRAWVAAEAERRLRIRFATAAVAAGAETAAPLPPPIPWDATGLAWRDDELDERVGASRALCAAGDYELALDALPEPGQAPGLAAREHARVLEAMRRRDELLALALRTKARLAPLVGGERVGGEVVAVERQHLVLRDRGEDRRLPLTALEPASLANELRKHGVIDRGSWLSSWLAWLAGQSPSRALRGLPADDAAAEALRGDLTADFDRAGHAPAVALAALQRVEPAAEPVEARAQLDALREAILDHRGVPLFARREAALRHCATALAQRAFSLGDPRCLGLAGHARAIGGGRIAVEYRGTSPELGADFTLDAELGAQLMGKQPRLATVGCELRASKACYELRGSGAFVWPLPLRGPQQIRVNLELAGAGLYQVLMCLDRAAGWIEVAPDGVAGITDLAAQLNDRLGSRAKLYRDRVHELRIEHDGAQRLVVSLDGEQTAALERVGGRVCGSIGLMVHASDVLRLHAVAIEGEVDPSAALTLRDGYVERVLHELWPQ